MPKPRRLLTIGHSYCVALNRRLVNEMARVGGSTWSVTAVAPKFFHGDLGPIRTRPERNGACTLITVAALFSKYIHLFIYGRKLAELLHQAWDAVHCWEEPYIFAGGQVAWLTPNRTPLVFWTGQNISKQYPPPFSRIEQYCINRCAGWMARGQTGIDALLCKSYYAKPHRAIALGVDTEAFRPDGAARRHTINRLGWSAAGPPIIGYLGRFVEEKGLRILTAALDELKSEWRALLVGGGPLEAELRDWTQRYGDRARIVTGVQHNEVPEYLNAMDVLCAPSQTRPNWREVFGRMLIEAFACGIPVIASDSGEIPYVIQDAGVIVDESDKPGWVNALGKLLDSPNYRCELAARGLERARTNYAWPAVARQHLEFVDQVCG